MGRHSAAFINAQKRHATFPPTGRNDVHIGRVGLLAIALGIGAAVAGGAGVAHADSTAGDDTGKHVESAQTAGGSQDRADQARPLRWRHAADPSSEDAGPSRGPGALPRLLSLTQRRTETQAADADDEVDAQDTPSTTTRRARIARRTSDLTGTEPRLPTLDVATPSPTDEVATEYGDVGTWMLKPNGQISDYGGQLYDGKTLLEPVNVIIVDPNAKNPLQATWRLNSAMRRSGFPAQAIHTGGFKGVIDDKTYGQQPRGLVRGYSDAFFTLPNNHGRIFGPDPVETSSGFVWTGAFSAEEFGTYNGRPAHLYVSSNLARMALATALVNSGRATYGGMVPLDNAYNTDTVTTGDHDGYAVVIILR